MDLNQAHAPPFVVLESAVELDSLLRVIVCSLKDLPLEVMPVCQQEPALILQASLKSQEI